MLFNVPIGTGTPLQITIFDGTVRSGVILTVIAYIAVSPEQPFKVGTTEINPIIGVAPVLVAVNPGTFPTPLAPNPIVVVVFVHVYVAPTGELIKLVAATSSLLHTVKPAGTVTVGAGFTVIV